MFGSVTWIRMCSVRNTSLAISERGKLVPSSWNFSPPLVSRVFNFLPLLCFVPWQRIVTEMEIRSNSGQGVPEDFFWFPRSGGGEQLCFLV